MATLLHTDGTVTTVTPTDGVCFTLAQMQAYVGGHIQILPAGRGEFLVCNEEGKLHGLPTNPMATTRFARFLVPGDYLVGDVLLCSASEAGS